MKKNLLNLSDKLDAVALEIIEFISVKADAKGIPFFIVGATARDLFFSSRRATIDLGIHIATWQLFDELISDLVSTGNFTRTRLVHRIIYKKAEYPIDIVPFGGIANADGTLSWPDREMSTLGFEEAFQDSCEVKINSNSSRIIRVASPVGLVIMKLVSWSESTDRAEKDAQDLDLILSNYHAILNNSERAFDYPDIMNSAGFDLQRAAAMLLGKDVRMLIRNCASGKAIQAMLAKDTQISKLAIDMMTKNRIVDDEYGIKIRMIHDFRAGLSFHE